jgi:putative phosphoesterase
MKIFFASDIHGSPACLTMALDAFTREKAGVLVLLGDLLYHGPRNPLPGDYDPAKTAAMLNEYREHIVAVRGNCDSEVDQTLLDFPIMADHSTILDGTTRLFLTHGHLFSPDSLPPLPAGSVFVFGHTHVPMAEMRGSVLCANPGSTTLPKEMHAAGYGIFEHGVWTSRDLRGNIVARCVLP